MKVLTPSERRDLVRAVRQNMRDGLRRKDAVLLAYSELGVDAQEMITQLGGVIDAEEEIDTA